MTVALPVRNMERYLDFSVGSILAQTMPDFELSIVDDASEDGTFEKALSWAQRDPRIRVTRSESPLGLAQAANRAVSIGTAPFVARQDADDWSDPRRLETQLALMEPGVALVGSVFDTMDRQGRPVRPPDRHRLLRSSERAPFAHTSTLVRREHFEQLGGYRDACVYFEDQDLYWRLSLLGRVRVQTQSMVRVRAWQRNSRNLCELDYYCAQMQKMLAACDALQRGEGMGAYEAIVHGRSPARDMPSILYWRCTSALWSAEPSGLLSLLWRYRAWPRTRADLGVWAAAVGSALSPRLLRAALRSRSQLLNLAARGRLPSVVDWRYPWQSAG